MQHIVPCATTPRDTHPRLFMLHLCIKGDCAFHGCASSASHPLCLSGKLPISGHDALCREKKKVCPSSDATTHVLISPTSRIATTTAPRTMQVHSSIMQQQPLGGPSNTCFCCPHPSVALPACQSYHAAGCSARLVFPNHPALHKPSFPFFLRLPLAYPWHPPVTGYLTSSTITLYIYIPNRRT